MELRDYLRMLRRGWPAIVLITALFVGLAALYVAVAPQRYESQTVLFVSGQSPQSTGDLNEGNSFALSAVVTYGKIIASDAVLGPAGASMLPRHSVGDLLGSINAVVPEDTTLIVITGAGSDPDQAAAVANAVAVSATRIIPSLQVNNVGRPLVEVHQLRPAVSPSAPVSPDTKRIIALGLVIGLCVGLALTISAQTLDTRIRRADDVRELTDIPVLAEIPHAKRTAQHSIGIADELAGTAGEAYRRLRTNLGFMELRDRRSLVFAMVADGRGGAQVPINLAWTLAKAGRRILLVDLDLRRWTVGDTLGLRRGTGLADVLLGKADLSHVVRETAEARLKVVLSGTTQASPSDLLSAPAMNDVLLRMEDAYDYVILHAPPVLSYTDATVISRAAGGTFLTVAAGRTRTHQLTTALDTLGNARVEPLGLVLAGTRFLDGLAAFIGNGFRKQQPATMENNAWVDESAVPPHHEIPRPRPSPRPRIAGTPQMAPPMDRPARMLPRSPQSPRSRSAQVPAAREEPAPPNGEPSPSPSASPNPAPNQPSGPSSSPTSSLSPRPDVQPDSSPRPQPEPEPRPEGPRIGGRSR